MRRCIKPSNVVISMAGPSYRDRTYLDFEKVNMHMPRWIAKISKKLGVKKLIHFSNLGAHPDSESYDLKTKYYGE